jgi:hypothetical protein
LVIPSCSDGQGEDYLSVLKRRLTREYPERVWEVINTAVPGYNTAMEAETLKVRGLAFQPDLVILGYCGNDFELPNFIWSPEEYLSFHKSFLALFVGARLGRWHTPELRASSMQEAPRDISGGFEDDPDRVPARYRGLVGWDAFAHALQEVGDLGRQHGFSTAFLVFHPGLDGRRPKVIEYVRTVGLSVINVGAAQQTFMRENGIQTYEGSALTVSAQDLHLSALSHRMAAGVILEWMGKEGLLPTSAGDTRASQGTRHVQ